MCDSMCNDLFERGTIRMITIPIYISPKGGSIVCFSKNNRRVFQSCSASICRYSQNLHCAKLYLNILESNLTLQPEKELSRPLQRKTTLKWNMDGELSEFDKTKIFSLLSESELNQCELDLDVA